MRGGWHGTLGLLACIILSITVVHADEVKKDVNKESAVFRSGTNATLKDVSPRIDSKDEKSEIVPGKEANKKLELEPKDAVEKSVRNENEKPKVETLSPDQIRTLKTASLHSHRRNRNIVQHAQINGNLKQEGLQLHPHDSVSLRANSPNRRSMASETEDTDVTPDATSRFGYSGPAQFIDNGRPMKIQDHEILLPHLIPSLANVIVCAREGDMYYLTRNRCYICACVRYGPNIIPKCAQCMDTCGAYPNTPIIPLPPSSPSPSLVPEVPIATESCYPFTNLVAFENPLNPCQTCVCSPVINSQGLPDIMVTCENNLECVLPTNSPSPSSPYPGTDNYIVPPRPSNPPDILIPRPTINPNNPPLRWPPGPVTPGPVPPGSLPPGPLPGPSPHDTCSPYPPNTYFEHPWDECQTCICMESRNAKGTEIEVSCRTRPECCVLPPPTRLPDISEPNTQPGYLSSICKSRPLDQIFSIQEFPCNNFICRLKYNQIYTEVMANNQCKKDLLIIPDKICEYKSIGVEFMHPQEKCKVCRCEVYGSIVAPICKKGSMQECETHTFVPMVPEINIIFIEPQCKYTPPHQDFAMGCTKCQCAPVFSYVVANCLPQPVCEKFPTPIISEPGLGQGLQLKGQTQVYAQAQAQQLAQSLATSLAQTQSQGQTFVQGQSQAVAQSIAQGQSQALAQSVAQTQGNGASAQAQATASSAPAIANGIGDYATNVPGVPIQYPYLPEYQSNILYGQGGQPYQGGQAFQGGQPLGGQTYQGIQPLGGQAFQGQTFQGNQPLGGQAFQGQTFQGNQPFPGGQSFQGGQPLPTSSYLPQWTYSNQYQYPSNMYYYQPVQGQNGDNQYGQGYSTVDWQPVAQNQYSYPVPYPQETINTQTLAIAEASTDDSSLGAMPIGNGQAIPIGNGQIPSNNMASALSEANSVGPTSAYAVATGSALTPTPSSKLRLRLRSASRPDNE